MKLTNLAPPKRKRKKLSKQDRAEMVFYKFKGQHARNLYPIPPHKEDTMIEQIRKTGDVEAVFAPYFIK